MSKTTTDRNELLFLTAGIVAAYVGNNATKNADVALLIHTVFDTLHDLETKDALPAAQTPAVPIRRSITDDYIVCLEDGKKLKMLKRHLMAAHGMTPAQYRARWGLKPDYPLVAQSHSARRRELAKEFGLGRKSGVAEAAPRPKPTRKLRAKKAVA